MQFNLRSKKLNLVSEEDKKKKNVKFKIVFEKLGNF